MASRNHVGGDPLTQLRKCYPYIEPDLLVDLLHSSGGQFNEALKAASQILGQPTVASEAPQPQSNHGSAAPAAVAEPPRDATASRPDEAPPVVPAVKREDVLVKQFSDMFPAIPMEEVRRIVSQHNGNTDACFDALTAYAPHPGVFDNEEQQAESVQPSRSHAAVVSSANEEPSSSAEGIVRGMFPMVSLSEIRAALDQCNGDAAQCVERLLAAQVEDEDIEVIDGNATPSDLLPHAAPPPPAPADSAVSPASDPKSDVTFWTSMFPTLPIDDIREVLQLNASREGDEEAHQNAVFNNLRKRVNKRARQVDALSTQGERPSPSSPAAATSVKPLNSCGQKNPYVAARPTGPVAAVQTSPSHPPNAVVRRTEQLPRHHYHIFWDYDNINGSGNTQCDPLRLLNDVRAFFSHVSPHIQQSSANNTLHIEVYIVPNSRISQFQIGSLRDTGAKIVQCGPKPGDADRQICKAVMEFATMGFAKDQHTVVIMSSDKDFTSCATFVKSSGYTAWCVHDAKPRSNHLNVLQEMYTRCVSLHEVMAHRCP